MSNPEIKVVPTADEVAIEAAERVVAAAELSIRNKGSFAIALSGGSTPKALFDVLASDGYRERIQWPKVEVFFGDERCVPPDSDQSNFRMARESLLSKVPIPGDNIYRMHGESDPHQAAAEYGKMLQEKFEDVGIDLVLLGMGDDGHTASLFPGTEALKEEKHRCVANYVEQLKAWRITLTAPFINRSWEVMILVTGKGKAARVAEVLEGPADPDRLPIQLIQPDLGKLVWVMDSAAAGMEEIAD
jgi:6-phosphogluconolactonase